MADSVAEGRDGPPPDEDAAGHAAAAADDGTGGAGRFDELRALIVGPERREIDALRARLADTAPRVREVSRVLPEAIALRGTDPHLTRALTPSVEEAITASVRRDPRPLADALFPAMGPAIRKALAHTLAAMVDSLNRTVEQSLSLHAVRWRWTALRTGRPFGEIVLLSTLQYRVEQVFLIHRETGLLLQHVASDPRAGQDADQISAMLTAIRDFVRDSFHVSGEDGVEALHVGELTVLVEQGPHAVLAGVVRGTPPYTLRAIFQDAIETIHLRMAADLEGFRGDAAPFERARPILEGCLVTRFRPSPRGRSIRRWAIAGGLLLLVLAAWSFVAVRERQRWNAYLERLRAEPGIVVLATGRRAGRFVVAGLRDPLAADPGALLAPAGLPAGSVEARWEPYEALHPPFVEARARDLLRPPPGVTVTYATGVLTATGPAPARWVLESERIAPAMAGVRRFSYAGTAPEIAARQRLEGLTLRFARGRAEMTPGQDATRRRVADALRELDEILRVRGARARVEVVGHTDNDGSDLANAPLSRARANAVLATLDADRFAAIDVVAVGSGSAAPETPGVTEEDKARNRRVSFRVQDVDGGAPRDATP